MDTDIISILKEPEIITSLIIFFITVVGDIIKRIKRRYVYEKGVSYKGTISKYDADVNGYVIRFKDESGIQTLPYKIPESQNLKKEQLLDIGQEVDIFFLESNPSDLYINLGNEESTLARSIIYYGGTLLILILFNLLTYKFKNYTYAVIPLGIISIYLLKLLEKYVDFIYPAVEFHK